MILFVLLLVLVIFLVSPAAPYAREWGYFPSGGLGMILVVLLVLWFLGYLPHR